MCLGIPFIALVYMLLVCGPTFCLGVLSRCLVFFYCYMREVIPEFISGDFRSCLFLVRVVSLSLIFCLMSSDDNWHV